MSNEVDELAAYIADSAVPVGGAYVIRADAAAETVITAGYRKVFDGDCGLSKITDPTDKEAAEAWMRWANLAMNDEIGAIGAMKQMLTEFGYRRQK